MGTVESVLRGCMDMELGGRIHCEDCIGVPEDHISIGEDNFGGVGRILDNHRRSQVPIILDVVDIIVVLEALRIR